MATEKELALVLPPEAVAGSEAPVHFANFPGVYTPGVPIAVTELGFATEKEALARVKLLGLPLEEQKVDAGLAPLPERPNHIASGPPVPIGAAPADSPLPEEGVESKVLWPRTHAELDALADEYAVEFTEGTKVADKIAALEAAGVAPPSEGEEG